MFVCYSTHQADTDSRHALLAFYWAKQVRCKLEVVHKLNLATYTIGTAKMWHSLLISFILAARSDKLDCLPVKENQNGTDVGPGTKTMSSATLQCSLKLRGSAQMCDNVSLRVTLEVWI